MARKKQEVWNCLSVRQPYAWAIMAGAKETQYGYLLRDPVRLRQPIPAKGSTAIPFKFRP